MSNQDTINLLELEKVTQVEVDVEENTDRKELVAECRQIEVSLIKKTQELEDCVQTRLSKSYPYSLLIVGGRGVGKTTLFVKLEEQLRESTVAQSQGTNECQGEDSAYSKDQQVDSKKELYHRWKQSGVNLNTVQLDLKNMPGKGLRPGEADIFLWDLRMASASAFYYSAKCIIILFDLARIETYREAQRILDDASAKSRPGVKFVMIGNDTLVEQRAVAQDEFFNYCQNHAVPFVCDFSNPAELASLSEFVQGEVLRLTTDTTEEIVLQDTVEADHNTPVQEELHDSTRWVPKEGKTTRFSSSKTFFDIGKGPNIIWPATGTPLEGTVLSKANLIENLRPLFDSLDTNRDGSIPAEDFHKLYTYTDESPEDMNKLVEEMSALKDGRLSFTEFCLLMLRIKPVHDDEKFLFPVRGGWALKREQNPTATLAPAYREAADAFFNDKAYPKAQRQIHPQKAKDALAKLHALKVPKHTTRKELLCLLRDKDQDLCATLDECMQDATTLEELKVILIGCIAKIPFLFQCEGYRMQVKDQSLGKSHIYIKSLFKSLATDDSVSTRDMEDWALTRDTLGVPVKEATIKAALKPFDKNGRMSFNSFVNAVGHLDTFLGIY